LQLDIVSLPAANRAGGHRRGRQGFARWTDASGRRPNRKRRLGGTLRPLQRGPGFRADVSVHSTWRRINLPAPPGIHRADCGGQIFDPYSL